MNRLLPGTDRRIRQHIRRTERLDRYSVSRDERYVTDKIGSNVSLRKFKSTRVNVAENNIQPRKTSFKNDTNGRSRS